jgi:hypothetical protein
MKASDMMQEKTEPRASDMAEVVPAGLTVKLQKAYTAERSKAERDIAWPDFVREQGYELNAAGQVIRPE